MKIGVPKEIKDKENRVALTPAGARALVEAGHEVLVQAGAGLGSGLCYTCEWVPAVYQDDGSAFRFMLVGATTKKPHGPFGLGQAHSVDGTHQR